MLIDICIHINYIIVNIIIIYLIIIDISIE